MLSPHSLAASAACPIAEHLVEDLDALAVRTVHRERSAQEEVGTLATRRWTNCPGSTLAAIRRGLQRDAARHRGANCSLESDGRRCSSRASEPPRHATAIAHARTSVEVLQRDDAETPFLGGLDRLDDRVGRRDGRDVRDAMLHRRRADVVPVRARLLTERRVDHELYLVVLDRVDDVGPTLVHLEDLGDRDPRRA